MTPTELLPYLRAHGKTERALTHGSHINQLLELAGHPEGYVQSVDPDGWFNLYLRDSEPLILLAEARLANPPTAKIIPFPLPNQGASS